MPSATTRTIRRSPFQTTHELIEVLLDFVDYVERFHQRHPSEVHLDCDINTALLVEKTLTDGSTVYNIELFNPAERTAPCELPSSTVPLSAMRHQGSSTR